jgi:hypothetical protein
MAAILAHFRFLKRRHRHKKPNPASRNCDAVRQRNLHCSGAAALRLVSDTRPEKFGRWPTEKATRPRKQNFVYGRHAKEQFPSCVRTSAIPDCQHEPLRYDDNAVREFVLACNDSPVPTSVMQGSL